MSEVYVSFLFVRHVLRSASDITPLEKSDLESSLLRRWNRIYSQMHYISFVCDPLYTYLRDIIQNNYGVDLIGMGNGDINM